MKVLDQAKRTSNRLVARTNNIDESVICCWQKQEEKFKLKVFDVKSKAEKSFCLHGTGRKVLKEDMQDIVLPWIMERRYNRWRVTREGLKNKAKVTCQEFLGLELAMAGSQCYRSSLRQKSHQSQKLPPDLAPKVTSFLGFMRNMLTDVTPENVLAMDESAAYFDSTANKTVAFSGEKAVAPVPSHEPIFMLHGVTMAG